MSRAAHEELLTVEAFTRLPDDGGQQELVAGHVVSEPLPAPEHGRISAKIAFLLTSFVRTRGIGIVFACDSGYILARDPDTVRGPDVSFVSLERWKEWREGQAALRTKSRPAPYFSGAPELAVEVLSPGDRRGEVRAKVADYLAAGAPLVWVVDPASQTVTVYRSLLSPKTLKSDEDLGGENVLPGFSVKVSDLFEI